MFLTVPCLTAYSYRERDTYPQTIPDKPPYTAHLGNLSYDATQETVNDFFADCEVTSVRIVEDREQGRPKGFGYAEFRTPGGLEKALTLDGQSFQGRNIRIRIADPRESCNMHRLPPHLADTQCSQGPWRWAHEGHERLDPQRPLARPPRTRR